MASNEHAGTRHAPRSMLLQPLHERLLALALDPDVSIDEHWDQVRVDVQGLSSEGVRQLLPLVHRRLVEANVGGPDVEGLGRTVRDFWVGNQILFADLEAALEVLDAAGIAHIALKGVPLALAHYPHVSLRPMADVDLLVQPESAPSAVAALRKAGWRIEWEAHPDDVVRTSEVPCRSPIGQGVLDLHWRLVPWVGRSWLASDPGIWADAVPLVVGRRSTLAPAPPDLLLHAVLHAYRSGWDRVPRWVADVVILLRSREASFDWDHFVRRVLDGHLALPVREALAYAVSSVGAPVPGPVLDALGDAHASGRERRKHRIASRPITMDRHWFYGQAASLHTSWSRTSINYTRRGEWRSLPPFLAGRIHTDRLWAAPFVIARRRLTRLRSSGSHELG